MPFFRTLLLRVCHDCALFGQARPRLLRTHSTTAITSSAVDSAGTSTSQDSLRRHSAPSQRRLQREVIPVCSELSVRRCPHSFVAQDQCDGATLVYGNVPRRRDGSDVRRSILSILRATHTSQEHLDLPLSVGAYQRTPAEGFVTERMLGIRAARSTYVTEPVRRHRRRCGRHAYITGNTTTKSFQLHSARSSYAASNETDCVKLDPTLIPRFTARSRGGLADSGRAIAVDAQATHISGATSSLPRPASFPIQIRRRLFFRLLPEPTDIPQLLTDISFELSPDGSRLIFSSVHRRRLDEAAQALRRFHGAVYVSGVTSSRDLPVSAGSGPSTQNGRTETKPDASKLVYFGIFQVQSVSSFHLRFQIALNGDHLIVRSYSETPIPTTRTRRTLAASVTAHSITHR